MAFHSMFMLPNFQKNISNFCAETPYIKSSNSSSIITKIEQIETRKFICGNDFFNTQTTFDVLSFTNLNDVNFVRLHLR